MLLKIYDMKYLGVFALAYVYIPLQFKDIYWQLVTAVHSDSILRFHTVYTEYI